MERDYGKEIDGLREQLEEIRGLLKKPDKKPGGHIHIAKNMHPMDERYSILMEELCERVSEKGGTGEISYFGVFASGDNQSNWMNSVSTDKLLELIESNAAAKVLACIGSNDRLNMLLALLRTPRTAAQLVEQCGYNTTGQVYHHLKPLLAADLVQEEGNRGVYAIPGHRVQGIIMLLAGISDMLNPKFSQGDWEAK
ncbi:MAG: ArsR family transcriptional regulator [Defluviitaleaceae bacterium]|nr:ArsR family transcriptional regulator [Defluviitaleaceae bacterium]